MEGQFGGHNAPFDCAPQERAANRKRGSMFDGDYCVCDYGQSVEVIISSFSFKTGPPCAANLVVDVRFLPDPKVLEEQNPGINGQNPLVGDFVRASPEFEPFFEELAKNTMKLVDGCGDCSCPRIMVAVGCTAGRHRSVFVAESLGAHIRASTDVMSHTIKVFHRDASMTSSGGSMSSFDGVDCRPCDEINKNQDSELTFEMDCDVDLQCVSSSSSEQGTYTRVDDDDSSQVSAPLSLSSSSDIQGMSSGGSWSSNLAMQLHYCPDTQKLEACDTQLSKSCSTVLGSVLGNGLSKLKRLRAMRKGGEEPAASASGFQPLSL